MSSKNYCAHREPLSSGFCPDCECDVSIWKTMSDTPWKCESSTELLHIAPDHVTHSNGERFLSYGAMSLCDKLNSYERDLNTARELLRINGEANAKMAAECTELRNVLGDAKVKLALYRMNHSGEYIGGVEYMELMNRIDAALAI